MNGPIIVGVDGSDTADKAARSAARLAKALDVELLVVCAYGHAETERVNALGRGFVLDHEERALYAANASIEQLRGDYPDLEITPLASEGKPAEALVDLAAERDAQMIVVGNRRAQGLARVLGSVASDVTRRARCDVYVAHTND